ncbi:MAG: PTS sugar transporter subunit IIA, partial [Candidatus Cloacimonetes bacterium]|nr:PTS sugar transporter subunit IIA [Candidatus Cloacimonadota bacterium]
IITEKYSRKLVIESEEKMDFHSHKTMDRILILLKKPQTMSQLLDFALLIHPKKSSEPLYPMSVVLDGGNIEENVIKSENLLTKAMTRTISANKSAYPITKIEMNLHNAVNKAIKEYRISKVIMGLGNAKKLQGKLVSSILEQYISSSNEMVFLVRITQPLNIMNRLIVILPPLITKQNGFIDTFDTVKQIAASINCKILLFAEGETIQDIQELVNKKDNLITFAFRAITSWKTIFSEVDNVITNNDMIIQMLARPGRVAWRMSFEKMLFELRDRFQQNNLLAVYPYVNQEEYDLEAETLTSELLLLKAIPESNFYFANPKMQLPEVFEKIVYESNFKHKIDILNSLNSVLRESPIELTEEMLLIHIHTTEVEDYEIYITINQQAFTVESSDNNPKVVFILLSPQGQPPERHLRILSEIAKLVQIKKFVSAIQSSDNYQNFLQALTMNETKE